MNQFHNYFESLNILLFCHFFQIKIELLYANHINMNINSTIYNIGNNNEFFLFAI